MPGIFINDGGQTSSAIGNILGGIATNLGPEAAAKAQLLREQTEQADWNNRLLSSQVPLAESAAGSVGGILSATDSDIGAGAPTVASTLSSAAQPPSNFNTGEGSKGSAGRGVVSSANMTPYQRYVANEVLAGRMSPEALKTAINIGQSAVRGPGATDAAVATRATTPLGPGQVINTTGQPGGPTITGGSEYGSTADRTGGAADPTAAKADVENGAQADANLGKIDLVQSLYDQLVAPNANPTGIFTEEMRKKLTAASGVDFTRFTSLADAKTEIRRLFASMVANLRDNQGQPMFKGGLDQIMQQFPDPDAEPERFKSAVGALSTSLKQQSDNGKAALIFLNNKTPENYNIFLQTKGKNAQAAGAAFAAAGMKTEAPASPAAEPAPASPAAPLRPATTQELVFARQAIADGQSKADVIAHAKAKGFDLGPNF